jgi:type IV pilus assembly protein PilM
MIRLSRSQVLPIGLDIGYDGVKMLQLETSGPSLSVLAAARHAFPEEVRGKPALRLAAALDLIRRLFRTGSFAGREVVVSLPREIVHVKNLRLPMIPAHELGAAVKFEARNIFPFDTEEAHVRHIPAGEVRQGSDVRQEVIVLAAKFEDVDNFLEQMHDCGAVVASLDHEPLAIYRTLERFIRRREDEQEVHVLVDIGARRSQVVIGKGREISFIKPIEVGSTQLLAAVSEKVGISVEEARALRRRLTETESDPALKRDPVRQAVFDATRSIIEELGREISLCLRYYSVTFRGQRPNKVRLVGGEACDGQLQAVLNTVLPIPAEAARPLLNIDTTRMRPPDRTGTLGEWALAFGLALRTTKGNFGLPDGTPREKVPPGNGEIALQPLTSGAEIVDLNTAINGPDLDVVATPAAPARASAARAAAVISAATEVTRA